MSQLPRQGLLLKGDNGYPDGLVAVLGRDAPSRVSWLGNLALLEQPALGFCGSRKATEKGLEAAADCAAQAAEIGIVVVSGYAAGVDASAHFQALANGGSTIIVLPEGISFFRVRAELKPVWSWGNVLVISQFQDDERWQSFRAMARNKVIIGLSDAMIVIEAGDRKSVV